MFSKEECNRQRLLNTDIKKDNYEHKYMDKTENNFQLYTSNSENNKTEEI